MRFVRNWLLLTEGRIDVNHVCCFRDVHDVIVSTLSSFAEIVRRPPEQKSVTVSLYFEMVKRSFIWFSFLICTRQTRCDRKLTLNVLIDMVCFGVEFVIDVLFFLFGIVTRCFVVAHRRTFVLKDSVFHPHWQFRILTFVIFRKKANKIDPLSLFAVCGNGSLLVEIKYTIFCFWTTKQEEEPSDCYCLYWSYQLITFASK